MAHRTEYEVWRDELAGKRESRLGHVLAAAVGILAAIVLIVLERAA